MLKLVFCLRRRAEMSRDEFQRYWRDRHAPLVARHAATLRIARYVQLHSLSSPVNEPRDTEMRGQRPPRSRPTHRLRSRRPSDAPRPKV